MDHKLKLFVWKEVLCDYTCGIVFAYARDVDHARKLVLANAEDFERGMLQSEMSSDPEIYDGEIGIHIWGSR